MFRWSIQGKYQTKADARVGFTLWQVSGCVVVPDAFTVADLVPGVRLRAEASHACALLPLQGIGATGVRDRPTPLHLCRLVRLLACCLLRP